MAIAAQALTVRAEESGAASGYAGLVTRAIAFAIDALIIDVVALATGAVVALALSILSVSKKDNTAVIAVGGAAFVLWSIGYFVVFWSATGQTPGNRVMHIRVLRSGADRPLAPLRTLMRFGGLVLAALPLLAGFLPILFTDRRRGLQDWIAGSVVKSAEPDEGH